MLLLAVAVPLAAAPPAFAPTPGGQIAHGERLGRVLGCAGCHNAELTGNDWSEPGFGTLWSANLTRTAARYSPAELAAIIRSGQRPGGRALWLMPSHLFTQLTAAEMDAIVAWLRAKPPAGPAHAEPVFEAKGLKEIADGSFETSAQRVAKEGQAWPPDLGARHARARHIVRATCAECHGLDLRGRPGFDGENGPPDLRIVAAYPPDDFVRLLRTGLATGNRQIGLMSQVGRNRYRHLTDEEVLAIRAYLVALGTREPPGGR